MQEGVVKEGFKDRLSHLRWINNCFVTLSSKGQCQFCKSTTTIYNEGSRAKDHLKKQSVCECVVSAAARIQSEIC